MHQNMSQHELHQEGSHETARTRMSSMSPRQEPVARHRQTLLLLLQIGRGLVWVGEPKGIESLGFVVEVRIPLYGMVGRGYGNAMWCVKAIKVDAIRGRHLICDERSTACTMTA